MGAVRPPVSLAGPFLDLLAFAAADLAVPAHLSLPPGEALLRLVFPPFQTFLYVGSRN